MSSQVNHYLAQARMEELHRAATRHRLAEAAAEAPAPTPAPRRLARFFHAPVRWAA